MGFQDDIAKAAKDIKNQSVSTVAPVKPEDSSLATIEDALSGAVQGATLGLSDEAIGALQAAGAKIVGEEGDIQDLYRKYQKLKEAEYKQAESRSPIAYNLAQLAGGVAVPIPGSSLLKSSTLFGKLGGGALKSAAVAGTEGALIGGLSGFGASEKTGTEALSDAAKSAALGGVIAAPLGAIGSKLKGLSEKTTDYIKAAEGDTGAIRFKEAIQRAKEGSPSLLSGKGEAKIQEELESTSQNIFDKIRSKYKDVQNEYVAALEKAPNITDETLIQDVSGILSKPIDTTKPVALKTALDNTEKSLQEALMSSEGLTAQRAKEISLSLENQANRLRDDQAADLMREAAKKIEDKIMTPELQIANDRMSRFRSSLEEGLGLPENVWISEKINKTPEALKESIASLGEAFGTAGTSQVKQRTQFGKLVSSQKELEKEGLNALSRDDLNALAKAGFSVGAYKQAGAVFSQPGVTSDIATIKKAVTSPVTTLSGAPTSMKFAEGVGETIGAHNIPGKAIKYAWPPNVMKSFSEKLASQDNPSLQVLGQKLSSALEKDDTQGINAITFLLLQNPTAKSVLGLDKPNQ